VVAFCVVGDGNETFVLFHTVFVLDCTKSPAIKLCISLRSITIYPCIITY
jgi:hypothetical protein